MTVTSNLASERFKRAEHAGLATPEDALYTVIHDLEANNTKTIIIISIDENGDHDTYFAGPGVGRLKDLWMVLQKEVLRTIEKMIIDE